MWSNTDISPSLQANTIPLSRHTHAILRLPAEQLFLVLGCAICCPCGHCCSWSHHLLGCHLELLSHVVPAVLSSQLCGFTPSTFFPWVMAPHPAKGFFLSHAAFGSTLPSSALHTGGLPCLLRGSPLGPTPQSQGREFQYPRAQPTRAATTVMSRLRTLTSSLVRAPPAT